jgi:hypothetical protein
LQGAHVRGIRALPKENVAMVRLVNTTTLILVWMLPAIASAQEEPRASWTKTINEHIKALPPLDNDVVKESRMGGVVMGEKLFDSITVFNDDAHFLWPGAMLDAAALSTGKIKPLTLARTPVNMSVAGIYASAAAERSAGAVSPAFSVEIAEPTYSAMADGLQGLLSAGPLEPPACKTSIDVKEFHSVEEALFSVGVSASFVVASIKGKLETERSRESNNLMAMLVQSYFTVHADHPSDPASFFAYPKVKADELKKAITGYQPVYVSQIEYGRMLFFVASSRANRNLFRSSVGAGFNLGIFGGSTELSVTKKEVLEEAEIRAVAFGGTPAAVAELLGKDKVPGIQNYMRSGQTFAAAVPIRYVLRYVGTGEIATLKLPYEYPAPPEQGDLEALEIRFYTETNDKEPEDEVVVSVRRGSEEIGSGTAGRGEKWVDQTGPHPLVVPIFRLVRTEEIPDLTLVVEKNGDDDKWIFLYEVFAHLRNGKRVLVKKQRDPMAKETLGEENQFRSLEIKGLTYPSK